MRDITFKSLEGHTLGIPAGIIIPHLSSHCFFELQPEASRLGTGCHITFEDIGRIGDPKRRRFVIRLFSIESIIRYNINDIFGPCSQIVLERIVHLHPIFGHVAMPGRIVGHIRGNHQRVGAMDINTSLLGLADQIVGHDGPRGITTEMEMEGLQTKHG